MRELKVSRPSEVGKYRRAISAGLAAFVSAPIVYSVFHVLLGFSEIKWGILGFASLVGVLFGIGLGVTSKTGGVVAGVFAALWIFFEIIIGVFFMIFEVLAALLAGLFSIFN